jgi:large subunit ribosomal protein L35
MPKMKSRSAAKKRFRPTGSGYKHQKSGKRHILTKKNAKRRRKMNRIAHIHAVMTEKVNKMVQG